MKHPIIALAVLTLGMQSFADADNSRNNDQDRATNELTAENQKTAESQSNDSNDMNITRRIRQEIMKEKDLSTYAQNVKIITVDGEVTLKGPVKSEQEKTKIMKYADLAAGSSNVKNELSVLRDKK